MAIEKVELMHVCSHKDFRMKEDKKQLEKEDELKRVKLKSKVGTQ